MVIVVNDEYRIASDENSWVVERFWGVRKGKEIWDALSYHADLKSALVALAERRIRLINSSVPHEIIKEVGRIREEAVPSLTFFRVCPCRPDFGPDQTDDSRTGPSYRGNRQGPFDFPNLAIKRTRLQPVPKRPIGVTRGQPPELRNLFGAFYFMPLRGERRNPMEEERCDCCGRRVSELPPFGGPGDPLVGDFEGELLVKKWRPAGPCDEKAEAIFSWYFHRGQSDSEHKTAALQLAQNYGAEEAERIMNAVYAHGLISSSWECRDCAVLTHDEYFEKLPIRALVAIDTADLMDAPELLQHLSPKLPKLTH